MERCDVKCKEILREEYPDYDKNSWHYKRELGMLLKAYKEGAQEIHDLVLEKLDPNELSGLNIPVVSGSLPSEDELQKVVERIAYEQHGKDQAEDCYAKMGILHEFVKTYVEGGNDR